MADLTVDSAERSQLNKYNSAFSVLGCLSVFFSYHFWGTEGPGAFRSFVAVLSLLSLTGFLVSTFGLQRGVERGDVMASPGFYDNNGPDSSQHTPSVTQYLRDWFTFLREVGTEPNFVYFFLMHLVQVFHCHFNSNFFPLFLDFLLGETYSRSTKSILLGVSFLLPHVNNIAFSSLAAKYGLYSVITALFSCKLVLALVIWLAGMGKLPLLVFFILSNRIFTEGTCKLIGLCVTDLVDEDFVLHNRKETVSALIFGTTNLVAKPGQTLAPLLGTWIITTYAGQIIFDSAAGGEMGALSSDTLSTARVVMFNLAIGVAVFSAVLQLFFWSRFALHGEKLEKIKVMAAKGHDRI